MWDSGTGRALVYCRGRGLRGVEELNKTGRTLNRLSGQNWVSEALRGVVFWWTWSWKLELVLSGRGHYGAEPSGKVIPLPLCPVAWGIVL